MPLICVPTPQPGLLSRFQPELDLCVRSALWFSSVCQQRATFGQQLLFICYDPDKLCRSRLALHYVLTVAARYAGDVVTFRGGGSDREWLQRTMQYAENASVVANFVNFFRFLGSGRRPSLVDVVLGLDHITMHGNRRRDVGYSSMTRELIWDGFMVGVGDVRIRKYQLIQCTFCHAGTARFHIAADQLPFGEEEIAQHGFAGRCRIESGRQ